MQAQGAFLPSCIASWLVKQGSLYKLIAFRTSPTLLGYETSTGSGFESHNLA
jgi:hypothetical protein